jgi:hypothetical protein
MTDLNETTGTTLLPTPTDTAGPPAQETRPARPGMGAFWPLVVLVVGAMAGLLGWALMQARTVEDVAAPQAASVHDAHIAQQLRERQALLTAGEHDPWIQGRLREQDGARELGLSTQDPWVRRLLRDRGIVAGSPAAVGHAGDSAAPQHDSGIAAALRQRAAAEGCAPPAPGAGGWEGRLALAC